MFVKAFGGVTYLNQNCFSTVVLVGSMVLGGNMIIILRPCGNLQMYGSSTGYITSDK